MPEPAKQGAPSFRFIVWLTAFLFAGVLIAAFITLLKPNNQKKELTGTVQNGNNNNSAKSSQQNKNNVDTTSLPADFAKDIPIYPGSRVIEYSKENNLTGLKLTSKDSKEQVDGYYNSALIESGWTAEPGASTFDLGGLKAKSVTKNSSRLTTISATDPATKTTNIIISVNRQ